MNECIRGGGIFLLKHDEKHLFLISFNLPSGDDAGMGSHGLQELSMSQKFLCVPHQPTSFSQSPFFQNFFSFSFNFHSFRTADWLALTFFCRSSIVLCLLFFSIFMGLSWACIVRWSSWGLWEIPLLLNVLVSSVSWNEYLLPGVSICPKNLLFS